eukprot:Awhi_evm1s1947
MMSNNNLNNNNLNSNNLNLNTNKPNRNRQIRSTSLGSASAPDLGFLEVNQRLDKMQEFLDNYPVDSNSVHSSPDNRVVDYQVESPQISPYNSPMTQRANARSTPYQKNSTFKNSSTALNLNRLSSGGSRQPVRRKPSLTSIGESQNYTNFIANQLQERKIQDNVLLKLINNDGMESNDMMNNDVMNSPQTLRNSHSHHNLQSGLSLHRNNSTNSLNSNNNSPVISKLEPPMQPFLSQDNFNDGFDNLYMGNSNSNTNSNSTPSEDNLFNSFANINIQQQQLIQQQHIIQQQQQQNLLQHQQAFQQQNTTKRPLSTTNSSTYLDDVNEQETNLNSVYSATQSPYLPRSRSLPAMDMAQLVMALNGVNELSNNNVNDTGDMSNVNSFGNLLLGDITELNSTTSIDEFAHQDSLTNLADSSAIDQLLASFGSLDGTNDNFDSFSNFNNSNRNFEISAINE